MFVFLDHLPEMEALPHKSNSKPLSADISELHQKTLLSHNVRTIIEVMQFETYKNRRNPHVTIHVVGCRQIRKRGGQHKDGSGEYVLHATYERARAYAEEAKLPIVDCSDCLPLEVRILPLNRREEFRDCESVDDVQQKYFRHQLPMNQKGCYHYKKKGLKAPAGTVVLFQCDSRIIASAVFLHREQFRPPLEGKYNGGLYFVVDSIKTFEPVFENQMKKIWPNFKGFRRAQKLDPPTRYHAFERELAIGQSSLHPLAEAINLVPLENDDDYSPQRDVLKRRVPREIPERPGQGRFRALLCARYGSACQLTGCDVLQGLEAAHINPYRSEDDNNPKNGLLLRADIHALFDACLLSIEPSTLKVEIHPNIKKHYGYFAGMELVCSPGRRPSLKALQLHYSEFTKRLDRHS